MISEPHKNSIELRLVGPLITTTLSWVDLLTLSDHGGLTIRSEKNRIDIQFAPLNLGIFGGPVEATLTVRRDHALINVSLAIWH